MTHIRQDTLAGHWVIISESRAARPIGIRTPPLDKQKGWLCPFCEGNESTTPGEVEAIRHNHSKSNAPGWSVRVVPNRYPALSPNTDPEGHSRGVLEEIGGFGHHEVIVESPEHDAGVADYADEKLIEVLEIYQSRIRAQLENKRIAYVQIFRNEGYMAGASLEHPHSQVLALPFVPPHPRAIVERSLAYAKEKRGCLACALIRQETAEKERVLLNEEGYLAVAPFASREPGEVMIFPRTHAHRFDEAGADEIGRLARVLRKSIWALKETFDSPAFNLLIVTAPAPVSGDFTEKQLKKAFHWHLQLFPRTTRFAGLEWGTGVSLNPMPPETAARQMRSALEEAPLPAGAIKR